MRLATLVTTTCQTLVQVETRDATVSLLEVLAPEATPEVVDVVAVQEIR